jgi:hypothetical protein
VLTCWHQTQHSGIKVYEMRGSHKVWSLLGCDAVLIGRWAPTFWRDLLLPFSGYKSDNTELAGFSELSVPVYQTIEHHIVEYSILTCYNILP